MKGRRIKKLMKKNIFFSFLFPMHGFLEPGLRSQFSISHVTFYRLSSDFSALLLFQWIPKCLALHENYREIEAKISLNVSVRKTIDLLLLLRHKPSCICHAFSRQKNTNSYVLTAHFVILWFMAQSVPRQNDLKLQHTLPYYLSHTGLTVQIRT